MSVSQVSDTSNQAWPVLRPSAWVGPIAAAVQTCTELDRHTEADPAGVYLASLVMFASLIGPGPYVRLGAERSPLRIYATLVGKAGNGRKGAACNVARHIIGGVTPTLAERTRKGFGSGEALVDALEGDARLLVHEPELSHLLTVCSRPGDTSSATLRDAWDTDTLSAYSRSAKKAGLVESAPASICLLGNITPEDLVANYTQRIMSGGLASRILLVPVRRHGRVPVGEPLPALDDPWRALRHALANVARSEVCWTPAAAKVWDGIYDELCVEREGGLDVLDARAATQVARLAAILTVSAGRSEIEFEYLMAAQDIWDYCAAGAALWIGPDAPPPPPESATGKERAAWDAQVEKLVKALVVADVVGMTGRQRRSVFSGHVSALEMERMVNTLVVAGLADVNTEYGPGRPVVRTVATHKAQEHYPELVPPDDPGPVKSDFDHLVEGAMGYDALSAAEKARIDRLGAP